MLRGIDLRRSLPIITLFTFLLLLGTACQADAGANSILTEAQDNRGIRTPTVSLTEIDIMTSTVLSPLGEDGIADPESRAIETTANVEESGLRDPGAEANADVEFVRSVQSADGSWTFYVTVRHPDTGWEDYADGWDVVTPDGLVIKRDPTDRFTRLLLHPHETEQPFTRSQAGLVIPEGVDHVTVRAHDLVAGFGGQEIAIDLAAERGPGYEVEKN